MDHSKKTGKAQDIFRVLPRNFLPNDASVM
jgi:hypothetical protein